MFYRGVATTAVYLFVGLSCCYADDWCCHFERARRLALERAGPQPAIETRHQHLSQHQTEIKIQPAIQEKMIPRSRPTSAKVKPLRPSRRQQEEIVGKARKARENGQLEHALRLYKLAQTMSPNDSVVAETINEIEHEMN